MCGRNGQPSQRCQQPNTSSRISASGVQDADFVESFLLRWHRRSCFRIDGQKIYREPKGKIVRSPVPDKATNRSLAGTTVQGLSRGMLSKAVQDASWASFLAKLAYQAEEAGRQLVKVDPRGTSQRCPCGARVPKKLSDREHVCTACGLIGKRDHVSAMEILRLGLSLVRRNET